MAVPTKLDQLKALEQTCAKDASLIITPDFPQLVFGKGNPSAKILFVGEAPGKNEALQGLPFVGAAGKNLNKFLESINMTLDDCYIANILKTRPPQNRPPKPEEMIVHVPHLLKQIEIIQPQVIIALGNFASKFFLANCTVADMSAIAGVSETHGTTHTIKIGNQECSVVPFYHPAACIYNPKIRPLILQDFQKIKEFLINKN